MYMVLSPFGFDSDLHCNIFKPVCQYSKDLFHSSSGFRASFPGW